MTRVCLPKRLACKVQICALFPQTDKHTRRADGEREASLNGACLEKKGRVQAVSELLQVSLTHSGSAGRFRILRPPGEALSLRSFFVLGVPHASFGVVVVKEVSQA